MVKSYNTRVRVIRWGNFKKKDQATTPATACMLCQLQAQDYCAQPGRSRAFKGKQKQKKALRSKWVPREKPTKHKQWQTWWQEVNTTPSLPRFSLTGETRQRRGVSEILTLVPEERNPVKVNEMSDRSSKKVLSNHHGSGDELGSMPYTLGTRGI